MQGNGYLDFGSKQVRMTFTTDATGWPKLPFIGEILRSAATNCFRFTFAARSRNRR